MLIQVDPGLTPICTFVPRQLTRDQIATLSPESWITKYEILHQVIKPVQSNNPFFIRKENGEVETRFLMAPPEKKDVTVFPTQIAMLHPVSYVYEDGTKINAFCEDGKPYYEGKSPSSHIWWDICDCTKCRKEETLEEDYSRRRKKNPLNKSSKKDMKQVIQKLTSLENRLENLTIMFFILELESKNSLLFHLAKIPSPKKTMTKTLNLH